VVDHALAWLDEAARRAETAQALPVSVSLHSQALRLMGDDRGERRVAALLGRASAQTDQRELDAARADIEEAIELASHMEVPALIAQATLALAQLEQKGGDLDTALRTAGLAVDRFRSVGDLKGTADALRVLGMTHIFRGEYADADASILGALGASRELGDRRGEAWALQNLAWTSYIEGRADEAEARLNDSAAMFQELGDSGGLNWALGLLAFVRFHQGKLSDAEQLGEQILQEAHARGDRWGEGMMLLLMSGVQLWSGRSSEAAKAAGAALDLFEGIGDRFGTAQARASVGRSLVTSGRVDEGLRIMREALDRQPALADGGESDQFEMLEAVSLAGAAVQIGDAPLALLALGSDRSDDYQPETIGHGDGLVAEGLALLQSGRAEAAVERITPFLEQEETPSPYGQSVLALAYAAAGGTDDVLELVEQVQTAPRSTYLDRINAHVAELLVLARTPGADVGVAAEALLREADAADDPVAQAVVRLAGAFALAAADDPHAEALRRDAERRLGDLGIGAQGWQTIFHTALADLGFGASLR
jgi:tetratricopeptide (TPR) repeat protein